MNSTMDTPVHLKDLSREEEMTCKDIDFSRQAYVVDTNQKRGKRTFKDLEGIEEIGSVPSKRPRISVYQSNFKNMN